MAYIGNNPADIGVYAVQAATGNGVLTAFTLDRAATTASISISIDGVDQIPTTAYAVTVGTTLTFTSPPPNLSVISIRFLGDTVSFGEPSNASVGQAQLGLATGEYFHNPNTISSTMTTTVSASNNAVMFGPITVNSGVTWTVSGLLTIL